MEVKFVQGNLRTLGIVPLLFLFLSAFIGLLMRYGQVYGLPLGDFSYWLQAHSHVTFLGWGFLASLLLVHRFFDVAFTKKYQVLWYSMIMSLLGMLLSFPVWGYKMVPITFLVLFLVLSYVYLVGFLKYLKPDSSLPAQWVKAGIYLYFLSSIAIFIIPVVLVKYGKVKIYYDLIYFYLHFLYNGYFTFVLFGLFFKKVGDFSGLETYFNWFFKSFLVAVIPAYALSLYWHLHTGVVLFLGSFSAFVQIIALLYFLIGFAKRWRSLPRQYLIGFVILVFVLKIVLQFLSSFPDLAIKAINLKPFFVVGYIHLFTIGFMTLMLLWLMGMGKKPLEKWGIILIVAGFILTESILFYQGSAILFQLKLIEPFFKALLWGSLLMLLGILLVLFTKKHQ